MLREKWGLLEVIAAVRLRLAEMPQLGGDGIIRQHSLARREGEHSLTPFCCGEIQAGLGDERNAAMLFDLAEQGTALRPGSKQAGVEWTGLVELADVIGLYVQQQIEQGA